MPSWRKDDSLRLLTAIASVNAVITGYMFSTSITCFTQKWVSYRDTDIFTIQFFAALKNSTLVWPMSVVQGVVLHRGEFPPVLVPRRSFHGHFPIHHTHVISRDAPLTGNELNFTSTDPDCVRWFDINLIPHTCNWEVGPFSMSSKLSHQLNLNCIKDF
jgi:hypothetical protein